MSEDQQQDTTVAEAPASEAPGPRQMAEPFEALKARLAEKGFTAGVEPESLDTFAVHAEFEDGRYEDPTDCAGALQIVEKAPEGIWTVVCETCGFTVGVNMRTADPERLAAERLTKAGIPETFASKTFDPDDPLQASTLEACRIWLRRFADDPLPAVALWGVAGVGKSHLLSLMVETLAKRGIEVLYRTEAQLFEELQDFANADLRWEKLCRVPVLAVDDIGASRLTDWRQDRFAALVDRRYSRELPLLIATNVPPQGWADRFGERTNSRLGGMCVKLRLEGADRRSQGVQESLTVSA